MPFYLTILKGSRADQAKAVVAVSDQRLIQKVLNEISRLSAPDLNAELQGESVEYAIFEAEGGKHNDPAHRTGY